MSRDLEQTKRKLAAMSDELIYKQARKAWSAKPQWERLSLNRADWEQGFVDAWKIIVRELAS
jgi:hypothetical protein